MGIQTTKLPSNHFKRSLNEITKKVYEAQKHDPKKGDFALLVEEDKKLVNLQLSDQEIQNMEKS